MKIPDSFKQAQRMLQTDTVDLLAAVQKTDTSEFGEVTQSPDVNNPLERGVPCNVHWITDTEQAQLHGLIPGRDIMLTVTDWPATVDIESCRYLRYGADLFAVEKPQRCASHITLYGKLYTGGHR